MQLKAYRTLAKLLCGCVVPETQALGSIVTGRKQVMWLGLPAKKTLTRYALLTHNRQRTHQLRTTNDRCTALKSNSHVAADMWLGVTSAFQCKTCSLLWRLCMTVCMVVSRRF